MPYVILPYVLFTICIYPKKEYIYLELKKGPLRPLIIAIIFKLI